MNYDDLFDGINDPIYEDLFKDMTRSFYEDVLDDQDKSGVDYSTWYDTRICNNMGANAYDYNTCVTVL